MAQKYYNIQETAQILGTSEDNIKTMLDQRELHGYRDGANWKFKSEDIDNLAKQRALDHPVISDDEEAGDDVLLSEVALGQSNLGTSGTVIGMNGIGVGSGDSDIQLAGSSIVISDNSQTPPAKKKDESPSRTLQFDNQKVESGSKTSQFENLDLTLDEDISLQGSTGTLANKAGTSGSDPGGSAIDLSGRDLEDDDLVLGGSGKGSDVTIGGDSGISLVDPADSGLSLDQPLDLGGGSDESLELGENDILALGSSSPALQTDSDFLLTPLDEASDLDESESGSQVIALDTEDDSAAMMGASSGVSMASMLDDGISTQPHDMGLGSPLAPSPLLGPQSGGLADGAPLVQPSAIYAESPYSTWQITGLAVCVVLLMLCGMMMYDNLRNMWSWDSAYSINSSMMDLVVGLFEGK